MPVSKYAIIKSLPDIAMHFAKHTKYASEQICQASVLKHAFFACRMPDASMRSLYAGIWNAYHAPGMTPIPGNGSTD